MRAPERVAASRSPTTTYRRRPHPTKPSHEEIAELAKEETELDGKRGEVAVAVIQEPCGPRDDHVLHVHLHFGRPLHEDVTRRDDKIIRLHVQLVQGGNSAYLNGELPKLQTMTMLDNASQGAACAAEGDGVPRCGTR